MFCYCGEASWVCEGNPVCLTVGLIDCSFRLKQADLTLVVVDCAQLPSDALEAAEFLKHHLKSVLSLQEHPETGVANVPMRQL